MRRRALATLALTTAALTAGAATAVGEATPRSVASYLAPDTGRTAHLLVNGCMPDTYAAAAIDWLADCSPSGKWKRRARFSYDATSWYETTAIIFRRGSALSVIQVYDETVGITLDTTRVLRAAFPVPSPRLATIRMTLPDYDTWQTGGFTCIPVGNAVSCNPSTAEGGTQVFQIRETGPRVRVTLVGELVPTGQQWDTLMDEWEPVTGRDPNCEGVTATLRVVQGKATRTATVLATRGPCVTTALG
jgi:hypothetical protein